jgi:two-component system, cell cycle response regulator
VADQNVLEVLVADPDDLRRARTARALRSVGWSVRECRGAHEAIEACRKTPPGVMVVDTDACAADDLPLIDAIKGDPELFPIGLVIRGRQLDVDQALDGLARGAHGILVDPVADAELVASVRSAARTGTLQRELRSRAVALERLAFSDALTEVANRRFLDRQLDALVGAANRHGRPLALAMIDLDHFKAVNDAHGHGVGDAVLAEVAARLSGRLRVEDHLGRFGGEEFLVLLPDTDADAAAGVAEALRAAVCAEPIAARGAEIVMTASVGWAVYEGESPHQLVARADAAMYRAKAEGRNRVAGAQGAHAA